MKPSIVLLFCLFVFLSFNASAQSNCTYTVVPEVGIGHGGAFSSSFNVTTQPGCAWVAISNDSWITVTSGASGIGSGTVNYSLIPNPNRNEARWGQIKVENKIFNVKQEPYCSQGTLSPGGLISAAGATNFLNLYYRCSYQVVSNNSWIKVDFTGTGYESSRVRYEIEPNSGAARVGSITIDILDTPPEQDPKIIFEQYGTVACTYAINPTSIQFPPAGVSANFKINTQYLCNWRATSNANWITVQTPSGSGSMRINYIIQPNTGAAREGTITVEGQVFTIFQGAHAPQQVEYRKVSGQVVTANNKPVSGARVAFLGGEEAITVTSNQFGYFHLTVKSNQDYTVNITHKKYKFSSVNVLSHNFDNLGKSLQVFTADNE